MDIRSVSSVATPAPPTVERDSGTAVRSAAPAAAAASPAAVAAAAASGTTGASAQDQDLDEAVARINKSMQAGNQGVEFAVDEDSKRLVVKVVDQETRQVLRQMPSVEALEIARALDRAQGLLIRQEA